MSYKPVEHDLTRKETIGFAKRALFLKEKFCIV
jgi:hypothetical protein